MEPSTVDTLNPLLYEYINNGDTEKVKLILNYKTNLTVDYNGTPLLLAIQNENLDICKLLINQGADIDLADADNKTPLMFAIKLKNIEICEYLINNGASMELFDGDGNNALQLAIKYTNMGLIKTIIEKDMNLTNNINVAGMNAVEYAVDMKLPEVVELLYSHHNIKNVIIEAYLELTKELREMKLHDTVLIE